MKFGNFSDFAKFRKGKWLTLFILLTLMGITSTVQSSIVLIQQEQYQTAYLKNLFFNLIYWWFWLAAIPVIISLSKKLNFEKGKLTLSIAIHTFVMLLIIMIHQFCSSLWCNYFFGYVMPLFEKFIWRILHLHWIYVDAVAYLLFVVAFFALEYQRESNENEKIILQLETRLAQAQLLALKMQLHPHFLFNTMNAISTLILKGEFQTANKMLVTFSEFLRMTLDETGSQKVPLKKELMLIENYLEVEKIRFQDRLNVVFDIHPSTYNLMVPNLVLQPLVENAIKHAIVPKTSNGQIYIQASLLENTLIIQIKDNGPGMKDVSKLNSNNSGIGIINTKERLNKLYGGDAGICFENLTEGGLSVTLKIPYAETEADNTNNLVPERNILPAFNL
jgi:two-component system LytT family sensor kinase